MMFTTEEAAALRLEMAKLAAEYGQWTERNLADLAAHRADWHRRVQTLYERLALGATNDGESKFHAVMAGIFQVRSEVLEDQWRGFAEIEAAAEHDAMVAGAGDAVS